MRVAATAATSLAPYGFEALDLVGAGVGLGAGVGARVGGASVGAGAGWEVVPAAGWVFPPDGAGVPAEGVGFPVAEAAADGDPLAAGAAEDDRFPGVDCVEAEVVAP